MRAYLVQLPNLHKVIDLASVHLNLTENYTGELTLSLLELLS